MKNLSKTRNNYKKILGQKYKGIEKKILIFLHLTNKGSFIEPRNFKNMMLAISKHFNSENLNWLYSFKDDYGSYFDHQIRNARTYLSKNEYIISKNSNCGPYIATNKLFKSFNLIELEEQINIFAEYIEDYLSFLGINNSEKKYPESEYIKEIEKSNLIQRLRSNFVKKIKEEDDIFLKNIIFELPQAAHIVPVWYLAKNKRFEDIENPNNGMLIDPNTHVLMDIKKLLIIDDEIIYKNTYIKIKDEHLNSERKKFIKERNQLIKKNVI